MGADQTGDGVDLVIMDTGNVVLIMIMKNDDINQINQFFKINKLNLK